MTRYIDLSQPIENRMSFYPGDPQPDVRPARDVAAPWRVSELHIGTHTGTHIDAASHYIERGLTINRYPIERFILPGICVSLDDLEPDEPVGGDRFEEVLTLIPEGGALVIRTAWDRFWGQDLYFHHPYLTPAAAQRLAAAGAGLVGIDALNVDSTSQGTSQAHETLLGRDILIIENLRGLDQLNPGEVYHFSFLPLALPGLDGSPVRAVAWKE
jgi:kynurenine formamidase